MELQKRLRPAVIGLPAAGLVLGFAAHLLDADLVAKWLWGGTAVPILLVLITQIVRSVRRGEVGLDVIAALSMLATLGFGEYLAAVIVALMYATGQYLEDFAEGRASREMTALLSRVPRTALRHRSGKLEEVALDALAPGDQLLVRQGDVIPVDGTVLNGLAILDESALTGESIPVKHRVGDVVMSGASNVDAAFDMVASRYAAESTYAGIVRLIAAAQRARAPMARLADRYALVFLAATVVIAGTSSLGTGDPIRGIAVLVIATPCPLILAVPIALAAGLSRAAKQGILVKGGKALETLASVRSIVLDKTGTLTHGQARLLTIRTLSDIPADEILRLAASLDQASRHVVAQKLVEEAISKGLSLAVPSGIRETPGEGIQGDVDGHSVAVGSVGFVSSRVSDPSQDLRTVQKSPGALAVAAAIDGKIAGVLILADTLRAGAKSLLNRLRQLGIERIVLATGDRREVAEMVASDLSLDAVRFELSPDQKTLVVLSERKNGPVMMIGDGVNDAPALAAADVGLAMGAKGAGASAEVADVVLLIDQLDRVIPAIEIARRSRFIALESVFAGIALSLSGMMAGAFGFITPVQGALLQELIDVAVILNALRALYEPRQR